MRTAIVIPARYASSRLPGKPLLRATGKYLIQHVYERACQARADLVLVATDDPRIASAVESFGGQVVLTRRDHPSGTDRVAEVARRRTSLLQLAATPPQPLEQLEKLEQLRALALGHLIQVGVVRHASRGVDTYEDYRHFVEAYRRGRRQRAA